MLNKYTYYHQRIRYSFHYHEKRIEAINRNRQSYKILESYFKKVSKGNIPNYIFNTKDFPRISRFKLKGIKRSYLNSYSKKFIRSGKINEFKKDHKLSSYAQDVFDSYRRNNINKKPGHDPILKNILIKDEDSIAIEIPIWKKVENIYITGHIDLLQFKNGLFKIIDYKPEGNFLYSLPQVASYGLIFKSLFQIDELVCVSFNKDNAWEYNPNILIKDIKPFFEPRGIKTSKWEKFL
ncbi:MAG: hypothetical protein GF317_01975 [Candidatus Lokiarchaeota archaeon]|nr:hypothetical protein [Candidatus Lokiarchaeota archaeon]MBD3198709.1 hypothetical protein [Candidatus Lokiarchaeota archaeon]